MHFCHPIEMCVLKCVCVKLQTAEKNKNKKGDKKKTHIVDLTRKKLDFCWSVW